MSESEYERAVLWVPDPTSPAGWMRRKVWADQPKPHKPPMGFRSMTHHDNAPSDETEQRHVP